MIFIDFFTGDINFNPLVKVGSVTFLNWKVIIFLFIIKKCHVGDNVRLLVYNYVIYSYVHLLVLVFIYDFLLEIFITMAIAKG